MSTGLQLVPNVVDAEKRKAEIQQRGLFYISMLRDQLTQVLDEHERGEKLIPELFEAVGEVGFSLQSIASLRKLVL